MPTIETATGPVDSAALGRVLMHEHVFIISPEMKDNVPEDWGDDETRLEDAAKRLSELKASGIDAILDPTALGLGRYIPRIATLASRIDLKILVATGIYTFNELPHYWNRRVPGSGPNGSDPMVDLFVKDITEGIAGTGIKAAVIKCATDRPGVTPGVERVLRACAKAHRATGAPITTHTDAASQARPRAAGDLPVRGRRPDPRRHRPQRRHRRLRLPRGADRQRQHPRHGPLRHRRLPAHGARGSR